MQLYDHQTRLSDQLFLEAHNGLRPCGTLATGGGKCLGKDTPVLMYDGTIKLVQDVVAGDLLMGPDSAPRTVLSTCVGQEQLYKIIPAKGDPYVVNESHVLSLRMTPGSSPSYAPDQIVNLSVRDYQNTNKTFRHCAKGWRTGVDFPCSGATLPDMPPYILGLWLGDGTQRLSGCTTISKPDPEVLDSLREYAESIDCFVSTRMSATAHPCPMHSVLMKKRKPVNPMRQALLDLGVVENRHIPHFYKCGSREARLQVLAGYLDADGCLTHSNGYDAITKVKQLAEDICFLARSLGFAAYTNRQWKVCVNNGVGNYYWRISISGSGLEQIPVRLPRRKAVPRQQKKNALRHGISLEKLSIGNYYGFEIDGDHLFLLGDFTVTHNTLVAADLARRNLELGEPTLIIAHRMAIVKQIHETIRKHCGITPQLITRDHTTPLAPITVAMVQTLCKRDHWIDALRNRNYIIDECHHAGSPSYLALRERLQPLTIAGLTATPIRPNGGTIVGPDTFSHLVLGPPPRWLIDNGFICDYDLYGSKHEIDTSGLKRQNNGEFSEKEHEERVLRISGSVVPDWFEFNPNREKTITIGVTVDHARQLVGLYRDAGVKAELIVGKIAEKERDRIFQRFEHGSTEVLVSVALIDEGLDIPKVGCVQLVRNIGSVRLQRQLIGRGLRKADGKSRLIVIDHGGSWRNPKIGFPCEDYDWPTKPKEKGSVKRKQGETIQQDNSGKVIVVNMVQTGSRMQLITPTIKKELTQGNDLARMNARQRADFFRSTNPISAVASKYEQTLIPSLLNTLDKGLSRPGAAGRSLARPGEPTSRRPR